MFAYSRPQLLHSGPLGGDRRDDPRSRITTRRQCEHSPQIGSGFVRSRPVRLVDHEDVRDLHETRLVRLHRVAPPGVEHHHRGVGCPCYVDLHLADSDRLHHDPGDPHGAQHPDGGGSCHSETTELSPSGHGADIDAVVAGLVAHAHPVPEDGPSAVWRGGVDRQHGHLVATLADLAAQNVGQCRLTRAGSPGDADHMRIRRQRHQPAECLGGCASPLHDRQQARERPPVALSRLGEKRRGIDGDPTHYPPG